MEFISLEFLIFFPIVVALNYLVKGKTKIVILTIISFYYYMTFARQYSLVLLLLLVYCYFLSYSFTFFKKDIQRKILLLLSVSSFIIILIYFRYLSFVVENIELFLNIKLRVSTSPFFFFGISYIIFQLIGYFIDIYYNRIKVEKNFFNFALFLLFFPKINSGPIERGIKMLPQFHNDNIYNIDFKSIKDGLKMFIWGYFSKVVISDRLSIAVNRVFSDSSGFDHIQILIAIIFFTLQVYTDFMGYTFMALGTSKMLGFNLTNNFHLPFFSQSIGDFWKRWHISLSFWLRDYLFLPLSYKSIKILNNIKHLIGIRENYAYILATFVTMGICGIWHGPKWTFLIWGLIHAVYLVISFLTKSYRKKFLKMIGFNSKSTFMIIFRMVFVFTLISLSFVFFRANTVNEAFLVINNLFINSSSNNSGLFFYNIDLYISFGMIAFLFLVEYIQYKRDNNKFTYQIHDVLNLGMILLVIIFIVYFGKFGESDFIYFKF